MKAIMREAINLKPILPTKKLPKESISYCIQICAGWTHSDVFILWVSQFTFVGKTEAERLYHAMKGQSFFLYSGHTAAWDVVTWNEKTDY